MFSTLTTSTLLNNTTSQHRRASATIGISSAPRTPELGLLTTQLVNTSHHEPKLTIHPSPTKPLQTSSMLPSTETLGIPELFEMILENARPQDVLLWQRVSKTWQAAIQTSSPFQEKLCFRAKPCKNENDQKRAVWNLFIDLFCREVHNCTTWCCRLIASKAFRGRADYPTASWKQMFVTSPAITEVTATMYVVGPHGGE